MTNPVSTSLRRSGARTRSGLVPVLASLLLGATLAGCTDDDPDTATDPRGSTTSSPSPSPTEDVTPSQTPTEVPATGSAGVTEATVLSGTDAGGSASTLAYVLDTEQARTDFAAQFSGGLAEKVFAELDAQETAAGAIPYGAVAAVGCDAPESLRIDAGEAGLEVTPQLPAETVQCVAPMTFVVLFAAPGA